MRLDGLAASPWDQLTSNTFWVRISPEEMMSREALSTDSADGGGLGTAMTRRRRTMATDDGWVIGAAAGRGRSVHCRRSTGGTACRSSTSTGSRSPGRTSCPPHASSPADGSTWCRTCPATGAASAATASWTSPPWPRRRWRSSTPRHREGRPGRELDGLPDQPGGGSRGARAGPPPRPGLPAGGVQNQPLSRALGQLARDVVRESPRMFPVALPDYLRFGPVNGLRLFRELTRFPSLERLLHTPVPTLAVLGAATRSCRHRPASARWPGSLRRTWRSRSSTRRRTR